MIERTFQYGFRLRLHRKDLAITLQTGRERRLPLMALAQAGQLMDALLAQGMGDLALLVEQMAGMGGEL